MLRERIAATLQSPEAVDAALEDDPQLPDGAGQWLARLRLLKGVPFAYLVPDEAMLPTESIRFFTLDLNWVGALLDGAFSIGRNLTTAPDAPGIALDRAVIPRVEAQVRARVGQLRPQALGTQPSDPSLLVVTGFLLRSTIVPAHKGMGVNVYPQGRTPDDPDVKLLDILRFEPLGPGSDTLICLVDGDAYRVDLHEAPEHLHYGIDSYELDPKTGTPIATKQVHTFTKVGPAVTLSPTAQPVVISPSVRPNGTRVLSMSSLAQQIAAANGTTDGSPVDSAEMGFEMTQGVGMVSFVKVTNG